MRPRARPHRLTAATCVVLLALSCTAQTTQTESIPECTVERPASWAQNERELTAIAEGEDPYPRVFERLLEYFEMETGIQSRLNRTGLGGPFPGEYRKRTTRQSSDFSIFSTPNSRPLCDLNTA